MFRLEKVEISGFKSFYDSAELVFPARLTAIVGPNGCGKSNICDAIIWVLGESRASHIRGGTMDDVIFQGSERRRPLGMGEVSLTLSTDNGHEAAVEGRIRIHRRVYRTGESEFRLNDRRVRKKDIADILMDTGLGIRNYSVMEQGKIDLILSNKPQDRRRILEEAAGITRYKTKRRAAELKLEETQANLLRIDDTLAELTRSLNSLKRQASKARRHSELASQLSIAKRRLYAGRVRDGRKEISTAEAEFARAREIEGERSAVLAREEASLAENRRRLTEQSSALNRLRDEMGRLHTESERVKTFLEQSEHNVSDLAERAERARGQISQLEGELGEQQSLLDEKAEQLRGAATERDTRKASADECERSRQERADLVRTHETTLNESRESMMRTIARISEARNQVHQLEIAVEKCEFYLGKLMDASRKVSEEKEHARERAERWNHRVVEAEEGLAKLRSMAAETSDRHEALRKNRDEVRDSLSRARDVISQTTYQLDSLRTLLTSLETQDEDVRRLILEIIPDALHVAEEISAVEGYETALDTILREVTQAITVEDSSKAIGAIKRLHETGAGRGTFVALDFRPESGDTAGGNVASAIIGHGRVADAVRAAVPEAYIVEDLDEALRAARSRPHATFVTRYGDLVRGSLIIGGKKEEARGIFSIKRQMADLESSLAEEEARATGIAADLMTIEEELPRADDARLLAEERVRQAESDLREMTAARDRATAELERFAKDFEVKVEEQALYEQEKAELNRKREKALEELRNLEGNEKSTQERIRRTEEALRLARTDFEEATEAASKARVDLEAAAGIVHAVQREHENLAKVVHSLRARCDTLTQEIDQLEQKKRETEEGVESARGRLQSLLDQSHEAGERRIEMEASIADLEATVATLETAAAEAREQWNQQRDLLHEAERRLDRARGDFEHLQEQIHLDLQAGIDAIADVEPPSTDDEKSQLAEEVASLTDKLEKMGPVNVLAIEEYRELDERETFLRTQRDDLVQSIDSLRSTIRRINATSKELFREAFEATNRNFEEIFKALFGGGHAEMRLLDEDDVLESGIELVAQPPGKKTQSIALLSGGERALTALALLFAIFRYKPSPFCILDEVDAPLDEVNNERFVRLLREMSSETQFVVITHSKRTMEAADVLYGVTMEEAGCSRLVSVSFAEVEG